MMRKQAGLAWLAAGALLTVTVGCGVRPAGSKPMAGASTGRPVYNLRTARAEARHLLGLIRLPPGTRASARKPDGAGPALSSYSVSVPVVPDLVDLHQFFTAAGTPASVIGWMQQHRPASTIQDDSGISSPSGQWTSFAFRSIRGFAISPELVVDAVPAAGGRVAVRVDAQVAPQPRLPGSGHGPGELRVVLGTMLGSFGYELRCDPAGGTVPDPGRICAAIALQPALLYSVPGPDHSCPPFGSAVSIAGTWNGKPLHSTFSVCTGGQEQYADKWASLLPGTALGTIHVDRGIGLVSLGEREAAVVDLLRGSQRAPSPCGRCTRTFSGGLAGWTVSFTASLVTQVEGGLMLTIFGAPVTRPLASMRRLLPRWRLETCGGTIRALVHTSASGRTLIVYRGAAFQRVIVTTERSGC